ncbi:MAG: hypothetical protein ACI9UK_000968 [Candidatus Krumholzibacteriia bacterium]
MSNCKCKNSPVVWLLILLSVAIVTLPKSATAGIGRHKGELYLQWGYNWSAYSASDLHFQGEGYDFTLHSVTAEDRPTPFDFGTYFAPARMTIPQYDGRLGYYIGDRTSVSFGVTHLKYIVQQMQGTTISGYIDDSVSDDYGGVYDNTLIQLDDDFLMYEHTDGLNYANIEIETMVPVWENSKPTMGLYATMALGAGLVTPVTDVTLFGDQRSDKLNLAGYGINTKVGLKFEFWTRLYLQYFVSVGWMDLSGIPTRSGGSDTADQSLIFIEHAGVMGVTLYTF